MRFKNSNTLILFQVTLFLYVSEMLNICKLKAIMAY